MHGINVACMVSKQDFKLQAFLHYGEGGELNVSLEPTRGGKRRGRENKRDPRRLVTPRGRRILGFNQFMCQTAKSIKQRYGSKKMFDGISKQFINLFQYTVSCSRTLAVFTATTKEITAVQLQ